MIEKHYLNSEREPKNVWGDFYTVEGECLDCGLPEDKAPTLLAQEPERGGDTYFIKQPNSKNEIEEACCAIEVCCTNALRYSGTDKKIIRRLGNSPDYCDYEILESGEVVKRKMNR
ncbi:MAG: hypothetical protein ACRBHB_18655 [Arenicella sp.]